MKETKEKSSSAIGCEVWMKWGSSMSRAHLTDRHKPLRGRGAAKVGVTREQATEAASHSMPEKFLAIFRRADSAYPTEHACKVLLCFKAAGHRDVQDTRLGRTQHLLRALYPLTQNKVMRAFACRLPKHP